MGLDNLPDVITIKQLAEFLQVSEITIKRAIKAGDLKALKVGKSVRIEKESVMEWLEQKNK